MKKITSIILLVALLVTVTATAVTSASAAEIPTLNSYDVFEDWEDYKINDTRVKENEYFEKLDGTKANFKAHYEYSDEFAGVVDVGGTHGKVLFIDNIQGAGGTYANVYFDNIDPNNKLVARNFTMYYDLYAMRGGDGASPWTGLAGRVSNPGAHYIQSNTVMSVIQNGDGESSDTLVNGNQATKTDTYYQYRPAYALGGGTQTSIFAESGMTKAFPNWYKEEGGTIKNTWYNVKVEMRESYISMWMKEEDKTDWRLVGTALFDDMNNDVYAGTFMFVQCVGEYYYDNIRFYSEDKNEVTANCDKINVTVDPDDDSIPATVGTAYSISKTAGDDTDVELIMSGYDGYVFGKWFKDPAMTEAVTPVSIQLQKYVKDSTYGMYEWVDVTEEDAQISTYEEMFETITVDDEEIIWNEYYSGTQYRLKVRVNTAVDGFDYYSDFSKQLFTVFAHTDGNGTIQINSNEHVFEDFEDGLMSRLELNQTATMIATPNPGYKFAGWYEEVDVDGEIYVNRLSREAEYVYTHTKVGAIRIIASFVEEAMVEHTINVEKTIILSTDTGYGDVLTGPGAYFYGEEITLSVSQNVGYTFLGFYLGSYAEENLLSYIDEETGAALSHNLIVDDDMDILAVYEIETYRVRITTNGLNDSSERVEKAEAGSTITLTATAPPKGYSFTGWIVVNADYEQVIANRTVTFDVNNKNIMARATYTPVRNVVRVTIPKVTFDVDGDGVLDEVSVLAASSGNNYSYGQLVTIKPTFRINEVTGKPFEGFAISSYTVKGADATLNEDGTLSFYMSDEPVTVRIEVTPIDDINTSGEIIMYVAFVVIGLVIVAALLFANNKDKQRERQ